MSTFKKSTLASLVGAAALVTAGAANAAVMVGGENGWEVSFDGNVNQFYVYTDVDGPTADGKSDFLMGTPDEKTSRLRNGLLPAFFSFNVKAPTTNGLDMGARISFAPTTNSASAKNQFHSNGNGLAGSGIDLREVFFTVDGNFGQVLMGRTLSLFQGKAILNDQTLFGVGASGAPTGGGTTLGRIGYGYTYPNFNSQIRWTSPDLSGFKVALAAFDPSTIDGLGMNVVDSPRWEGEVSWANDMFQVWASYMQQDVESSAGGDVDVNGYNVGGTFNMAGFGVMASYYDGEALGSALTFTDLGDIVDANGDELDSDGYIVQGSYTFAGATKLAVSYGESSIENGGTGLSADLDSRSATVVGLYHDVNANLKLVAEYSKLETEWHNGGDQEADVFGLGGFFFW